MNEYREIELKLQIQSPDSWEAVTGTLLALDGLVTGSVVQEELEAHYFDTPTRALANKGLAYRTRFERGAWVATVKGGGTSAGGLHQRQEWNVAVDSSLPDINAFSHLEIGSQLQAALGTEVLVSIVSTCFERQTCLISMPDRSQIEIVADRGRIQAEASDDAVPILEIELELKAGKPAALLQLGAQLAHQYPLRLETRSKYARGLELAGVMEEAVVSKPVGMQQHLKTQGCETLPKVLCDGIYSLVQRQNEFLSDPNDPETLHQLRVALRRIRSLLSFCKELFPIEEYRTQQMALRQWGSILGPLRELDVLREAWELFCSHSEVGTQEGELQSYFIEQRSSLLCQAQPQVENGKLTAILLELWAWLDEVKVEDSTWATRPIQDFVRHRLRQQLRKMLKSWQKHKGDHELQIHELRIQGKKIRYGLEYFGALFPGEATAVLECLKRMQDDLGRIHDADIAREQIRTWLIGTVGVDVAFEAGVLCGCQTQQAIVIRENLPQRWKKMQKVMKKLVLALE